MIARSKCLTFSSGRNKHVLQMQGNSANAQNLHSEAVEEQMNSKIELV